MEGQEGKYIINLIERKSDNRIVVGIDEDLEEFPENFNFSKQYIIEINDRAKYETLTAISIFLTENHTISQSQLDQLTIACSTVDISLRILTKDECVEVLRNTHKYIHDILEIDSFTVVQNDGKIRTYTWNSLARIFVYNETTI